MNPKKKSRRYRASVSIQALDLAISRFTNSLGYGSWKHFIERGHLDFFSAQFEKSSSQ
jgi:hypothetical protein